MTGHRVICVMLGMGLLWGCATDYAPNDSASRGLNEMKARKAPVPPKPDPRDIRIAELERAVTDRDLDINRLRDTSSQLSSLSGDLEQSKRRASDLESTLSVKDQELSALRSHVTERDRLANQLTATTTETDQAKQRASELEQQLAAKDQELAALRTGADNKDRAMSELASATLRVTALETQLAAKEQELSSMKAAAGDRDRLAAELTQAKQRVADLEKQLVDRDQDLAGLKGRLSELDASKQRASELERQLGSRDQELAGMRGALEQHKTTLAQAKEDLAKLLQAEVSKGNITMKQLGDQLTLGLATTLLFDSGEATLKPGGVDVLKRIGEVLKQYPDRAIHVAGHTDNVPIGGALARTFPSNMELSQARADSAKQALIEGGMTSDKIEALGHADSRPIASNSTGEGRQKNRRVEIVVKQ